MLFAFDLIEHDGDDLRDLPVIDRKRRLAKLIGKTKRRAVTRDRRLAFPKNSRQLLVPDAVNRRPSFRTSIDRSWSLSMPIT